MTLHDNEHRINNTGWITGWRWSGGVERKAKPLREWWTFFNLHFPASVLKAMSRICACKTEKNLKIFGWWQWQKRLAGTLPFILWLSILVDQPCPKLLIWWQKSIYLSSNNNPFIYSVVPILFHGLSFNLRLCSTARYDLVGCLNIKMLLSTPVCKLCKLTENGDLLSIALVYIGLHM